MQAQARLSSPSNISCRVRCAVHTHLYTCQCTYSNTVQVSQQRSLPDIGSKMQRLRVAAERSSRNVAGSSHMAVRGTADANHPAAGVRTARRRVVSPSRSAPENRLSPESQIPLCGMQATDECVGCQSTVCSCTGVHRCDLQFQASDLCRWQDTHNMDTTDVAVAAAGLDRPLAQRSVVELESQEMTRMLCPVSQNSQEMTRMVLVGQDLDYSDSDSDSEDRRERISMLNVTCMSTWDMRASCSIYAVCMLCVACLLRIACPLRIHV